MEYDDTFQSHWPFDPRLQCSIRKLDYRYDIHSGRIVFPDPDCCDMQGCIQFFEHIDPDVCAIYTFQDNQPDTFYKKQRGEWKAFLYDRSTRRHYEFDK